MQKRADCLQELLLQRLKMHVTNKVPEAKLEWSQWIFEYASSNSARVAALMVLQGHVKRDLTCLGEGRSLLAGSGNFVSCSALAAMDREGAYLYFDTNDECFIRSGKVSGRPFSDRHKEHAEGARKGDGSRFYQQYPSKQLQNAPLRKGAFENLKQLVALGFKPEFASDEHIREVFRCDPHLRDKIAGLKFTGSTATEVSLPVKMRHMVSYLVELAYDISLSPVDNVSQSPGFEACGLFA